MTTWVRGDRLSPKVQREALAAFVNRNTGAHPMPPYGHPEFATDAQWLAAYCFAVVKDGSRLDRRFTYCEPAFLHS